MVGPGGGCITILFFSGSSRSLSDNTILLEGLISPLRRSAQRRAGDLWIVFLKFSDGCVNSPHAVLCSLLLGE